MKKFWLLCAALCCFLPSVLQAQSIVSLKNAHKRIPLTMSTFTDYPPFGCMAEGHGTEWSFLDKAMRLFAKENNLELKYRSGDNYQDTIDQLLRGKTDVLLGIYHDTKIYTGLEYVFPAVFNNPVHLVMLPQNIGKIKSAEDLKNLHGVYIAGDHFSDYVAGNLKKYPVESVPDSLTAYEKLFIGEIDYVIGSYYYNYIEVLKLGLADYVSFSKQAMWNMPLFIGLSKASPFFGRINTWLKRYIITEEFKQAVTSGIKEKVAKIERQTQGTVPPKFVRAQSAAERTPADELSAEEK